MKLSYIAVSNLNSKAANAVHVRNMMASYKAANVDIVGFVSVSNSKEFHGFNHQNRDYKRINNILFCIWAVFKSRNVNLIHTRSWMAAFFSSFFKKKTILELHDFEAKGSFLKKKVFNWIFKDPNIIGIIYITKALSEDYKYLADKYSIKRKYLILPDGANLLTKVDKYESSLIDQKLFNIGYSGHLYKGKGVEILFELAVLLGEDKVIHVLGGMRSDIDYWFERACDQKLEKKIIFHGYHNHSLVGSFLQQMDVLLLPNQMKVSVFGGGGDISKYTSPLKMFEYMISGTPIIASDLPVLGEILQHNKNALIARLGDIDSWIEALEKLQNDEKLGKRISKNAEEDIKNKYTWNIRVEKIIDELFV